MKDNGQTGGMNIKYTTKDIGCYFDGAFGFDFNANRILNMAIGHGYTPHYQAENGEDLDALVYEMDDAIHYLNDNTTTPPNTYWSWEDGDFGLWMYCDPCGEVINHDEPCPYCKEDDSVSEWTLRVEGHDEQCTKREMKGWEYSITDYKPRYLGYCTCKKEE